MGRIQARLYIRPELKRIGRTLRIIPKSTSLAVLPPPELNCISVVPCLCEETTTGAVSDVQEECGAANNLQITSAIINGNTLVGEIEQRQVVRNSQERFPMLGPPSV